MISASNFLGRGLVTSIVLAIAAGLSWFSFAPLWPGVAGYYLTLLAMGFAFRVAVEIGRFILPRVFATNSGADILVVTTLITTLAGVAVYFLFPAISFSIWGGAWLVIRAVVSLVVLAIVNIATIEDGLDF